MRISDWSSDVCSSDLALGGLVATLGPRAPFIAAAILAGLNALAMLFLLPETLDAAHRRPFRLRDAHVIGAFRPLFEAGRAGPLLLARTVNWVVKALVEATPISGPATVGRTRSASPPQRPSDRKSTRELQSLMRISYA